MRELLDCPLSLEPAPRSRVQKIHDGLRDQWTYTRAVLHHFRGRLILILLVLTGGALAFHFFAGGDPPITFLRGFYYTWCLIFFEPPIDLPDSLVLDVMFFLVPILGLVVLIETFVEMAMTLRNRRRNEREWCKMVAAQLKGHVVLVGFGRLGFRTYAQLRRMRAAVVIIEVNDKNPFLEHARAAKTPILIGDGRNDQMLVDANIARAKSVICCTNDELANVEVALDSRRMNPRIRVVLRMFNQDMADKIRDGFNIQVAFSTSAMSAPSFAAAAYDPTIKSSFMVDGRLVVVSRIRINAGSSLAGMTVGDLRRRFPLSIVACHPLNAPTVAFPADDVALHAGDEILTQVHFEDLEQVQALNSGAAVPT